MSISDEVDAAQANAQNTANRAAERVREVGAQIRDTAQEKYEQARDKAGEYYERSKQAAHDSRVRLEEVIQERPLESLLVAAGIGLLLGVLWKRR